MGINAIALVGSDLARIEADAAALVSPATIRPAVQEDAGAPAGSSFASSMKEMVRSVDAKEQQAADKAAAVDSGSSDDLIGAVLASQEASLSFSMLMQVRNKVMGAFDELIRLQL